MGDDARQHATVRIGNSVLDLERGTLTRGGGVVPVRAKTFALLVHLAEHRGAVVSKDELLAAVWPGVIVSEDSLTQCVRDLRRALGDTDQRWLRTVSRRGYMLAAADDLRQEGADAVEELRPSVAVLPFSVSDDMEPVLADGIVEEVTNGLACFRTVTVVARASAYAIPDFARLPPAELGRRLGADHLVEGAFRKAAAGFDISVRLIHAPSGRQVSADRIECSAGELSDIDRVIARRLITRLVTNIEESVLARSTAKPPTNLRAFEHLLRGKMLLRGYSQDANLAAREALEKAVRLDPDFGLAHAYLALADVVIGGYVASPREVLEAAHGRARLAIALAPQEARCHRIMGLVCLFQRAFDAAEIHLRRALDLNPYDADTLAQMGYLITMRGRAEEGIGWLDRAFALNPFRPGWYDLDCAIALYALGRYREAAILLDAIPDHAFNRELRRAACHAMAADAAQAVAHFGRALEARGLTALPEPAEIEAWAGEMSDYEHAADLAHLVEGILRARTAFMQAA